MTLVVLALISVCFNILQAVIGRQLWAWFVVPTFGLPPLSIPQMLGIIVLISLLTGDYLPPKKEPNESWSWKSLRAGMLREVMGLILVFLIGWITSLFL